jgi:sugar O-acyltransferase (sialic acid O-acetyltransferase NeuD family)
MNKLRKIAIYGAGGFGKEVACIINKINEAIMTWQVIGFFDDGVAAEKEISHFGSVIGNLETLNRINYDLSLVFAIGNPQIIKKIVCSITNPRVSFPNIIHPDVIYADLQSFTIGTGNVVTRGCSFSCDVTIGDFNQINSISALAHDVRMGSFNVLMPLTRISGETEIGNCNFFGIGSVILQGLRIGENTRIGAGSVVIRNTSDGNLYMGNPATKMKL